MTRFIVVLSVAVGCSSDARCLLEDYPEVGLECRDALRVAARHTSEIRPDDAEVKVWSDLIELARTADPRFARIHTGGYGAVDQVAVRTERESAAQAWTNLNVLTGDEDVDAILVDSGAIGVEPLADGQFLLTFGTPISFNNFQAALQNLPPSYSDFGVYGADSDEVIDGLIQRVEGEPTWLRFTVLWGCSPEGCNDGAHWWIVQTLAEEDFAVVADEGGSPLPPEWQ